MTTAFEVSFYSYDNGHRDRRAAPSMHTPFDKRGAVQRINGIEFDFDVRGLVLEDALRCDWPRIGRLVEALACIQRIAFGASSVEDYERFLQEKGSAFEHLGKQMVRYAVSRKCAAPDDGFWEWTGQGEFKGMCTCVCCQLAGLLTSRRTRSCNGTSSGMTLE